MKKLLLFICVVTLAMWGNLTGNFTEARGYNTAPACYGANIASDNTEALPANDGEYTWVKHRNIQLSPMVRTNGTNMFGNNMWGYGFGNGFNNDNGKGFTPPCLDGDFNPPCLDADFTPPCLNGDVPCAGRGFFFNRSENSDNTASAAAVGNGNRYSRYDDDDDCYRDHHNRHDRHHRYDDNRGCGYRR